MDPQCRWLHTNSKAAGTRSLAKHWVFTAWDEPQHDSKLPLWATYLVYGQEICPDTGRGHWQGYVELSDKRRVGPIRALFATICVNRIWLGMRLGTPEQARDYAIKDGVSTEYGVLSTAASHQGERTDLQRIIEAIEDGSMSSVIQGCREGVIKNHQQLKTADRLLAFCEPKRDFQPTVIVHYGPSGTGKTRLARQLYPDAYVAPACAPRWWPGYDAHETVLLDEFRGSFTSFHDLLAIFGRLPYQIEYKGGHRQLLARTFIVTTPFHPANWYPSCGEQLKQLLRRISKIRYFYHEVDDLSPDEDIRYTECSGLSPRIEPPLVALSRPIGLVPDLDPEVGGNITYPQRGTDPRLSDNELDELIADVLTDLPK